ncbi:BspA family leucine-rich repeat surface protein [Enterococcus hirae]|uniref:BspA family leucine-rich repeat surface protein n=1 Tax=Enterococcus hirae TaxID=1354 RepID=UPI00290D9154|nr:BspA family leucine-rich repeat surface protein [Enterococcus hirae]
MSKNRYKKICLGTVILLNTGLLTSQNIWANDNTVTSSINDSINKDSTGEVANSETSIDNTKNKENEVNSSEKNNLNSENKIENQKKESDQNPNSSLDSNNISNTDKNENKNSNLESEKPVLKNRSAGFASIPFNLKDWEHTETADSIIISKYIGTNTDLTIPAEFAGKQIILNSINTQQFSNSLTSLNFVSVNGKKVKLLSSSMYIAFQNFSNLKKIDFSGIDLNNVTNLENSFYQCTSLQSINFGNNTFPNVTTFKAMFFGCKNLESVIGQFTMYSANNLQDMFSGCNKLKFVDTSKWDTKNVTNMYGLFGNNFQLSDIDVSNWDVSKVTNMELMFTSCYNIHYLDMTNWSLNNNVNLSDMFYSVQVSPLFLLTNDDKLLNYNYDYAWRTPYGPYLDANGGAFSNNQDKISFLGSPAVRPTDPKIQSSQFKDLFIKFMNTNIPTKSKYAFTNWNVNGTPVESASSIKDLFNTNYIAQWVSDLYSTSTDNQIIDTNSSLSFAYYPKSFNTGSIPINNSGTQSVPFIKNQSFNIGIKDRTRTNKHWYVTAQIVWNNNQTNDWYIQTNNKGIVNKNISTGTSTYDPNSDIVPNTDGVSGVKDLQITSKAPVQFITSDSSSVKNDVYDYDFGNVQLVIPEAQNTKVGSYQGNVEWNLITAP